MTPDVVVDVGNSRVKWAACRPGGLGQFTTLPLNLPSVWQHHWAEWPHAKQRWAVAGSNPERRDAFADWLRGKGATVAVIGSWRDVGIPVALPNPDGVGHDRLLNARSALAAGKPVAVVNAGTAVTVDLVDEAGAFAGGVIFPGVGTMAKSLHQFTTTLPLVAVERPAPPVPGTATEPAIAAGVWWAVVGGIRAVLDQYKARPRPPGRVLLTGGDAELLLLGLPGVEHRPYLTLEGIRLAAEALP